MSASQYSLLLCVLAGACAIAAALAYVTGDSIRDVTLMVVVSVFLAAVAGGSFFV
jgi:hypothetical protein